MGADLFVQGNPGIEQLITSTLQLESQPRFRLEDKKTLLTTRKTVLSDLDSKLSALNSVAKKLTDPLTDPFAAKATSSSDSKLFTATATSTALVGSHDISIQRLATSDTRVSQQYTSTGTSLVSFFSTNGSQTFQLQVAHPTTSDANNRVNISVTINSTSTKDEDVLKDIALAVNNAMSSAITAKTINADEKVVASVVSEESGKSRLIFKSNKSGFTNRMVMTDSTNSLLSTAQISTNSLSSGTLGGYITAIGTTASDSSLNSQLKVDGLTFYRDSNTVSDVLTGVALTLKNVTTTTESLEVSIDTDAVKATLQELLDAYNSVISFLRAKQKVDAKTQTRGALAGESTYSFLRSNLRGTMNAKVSGVLSGNPEYLFEIGITAASDGSLSFTDEKKFENALAASSTGVSDLFRSTSGTANQLKTLLNNLIKVGGVIDDGKESISDRIKSLDTQIGRFDDRLARREQQLRKQLARMQEISQLLGGQRAAFSSLTSTIQF